MIYKRQIYIYKHIYPENAFPSDCWERPLYEREIAGLNTNNLLNVSVFVTRETALYIRNTSNTYGKEGAQFAPRDGCTVIWLYLLHYLTTSVAQFTDGARYSCAAAARVYTMPDCKVADSPSWGVSWFSFGQALYGYIHSNFIFLAALFTNVMPVAIYIR